MDLCSESYFEALPDNIKIIFKSLCNSTLPFQFRLANQIVIENLRAGAFAPVRSFPQTSRAFSLQYVNALPLERVCVCVVELLNLRNLSLEVVICVNVSLSVKFNVRLI